MLLKTFPVARARTEPAAGAAFDVLTSSRLHVSRVPRRRTVGVGKLSTVSTGNLKRSLALQLRPINRVVYPGSLGGQAPTEPSSWHRLHA